MHPTDDVFKATIKSRGPALGMVLHSPREEKHTHSAEKLIADIKVSLAGYVAERIKYGTTSTGVSGDFKHAMHLAHAMVWQYGMGRSSMVGDFTMIPDSEISNTLKEKLNNETLDILNDCLAKVESFMRQEWPVVEALANELLLKNELDYDSIEALFKSLGKQRAFPPQITEKPAEPDLPPAPPVQN
jgi:cell division protease FtsH